MTSRLVKKRNIFIAAIALILLVGGYIFYPNHHGKRVKLVMQECLSIQKDHSLNEILEKIKNNIGISYDLITSNSDCAAIEKSLGYKVRVAEYYYTGMRIYADSTSIKIVAVSCPRKEINIFK